MKRRPPIFIISFAILACCAAFLLINAPSSRPASISFLWYTNRVKGVEEARAIGNEAEAIFQLTNHTSFSLRCTFSIDGSNAVSGLVSSSSGESTLPGHTTYWIPVVAPSSTNGWQFLAVISGPAPQARWQRQLAFFLNKVGAHPRFLAGEKTYQVTNVWSCR